MRILVVNKFYDLRGGTERVMFDLIDGLAERGHGIVPFSMEDPRNEPTPFARYFVPRRDYDGGGGLGAKLRQARGTIHDNEAARCLDRLLAAEQVDVAHLHNIYHQLSPSILGVLRARRIPTVLTLHDYKLACPSYTMFRDGQPCQKCVGAKVPFWCAVHSCSRGSRSESVVLSAESTWHRLTNAYVRGVDQFVAPSQFLYEIMRRQGVPESRMRVIPNAPRQLGDAVPFDRASSRPRLLYAGRLSKEKGLDVLLKAAVNNPDVELVLAGDGPMRAELEAMATGHDQIRFAGHLPAGALAHERAAAWMTVLPSIAYENAPLAVLESYASGRPALVSDHGGLREMVEEGVTGWRVPPGDVEAWRAAMAAVAERADAIAGMSAGVQAWVRSRYDFSQTLDRYEELYSLVRGEL